MTQVQDSSATFTERVIAVVRGIGAGETRSYAAVARAAGSPNAFRAVGSILKANRDVSVPCHRVVKSDGSVGEYNGLQGKTKAELLAAEMKNKPTRH